MKKVPAWLQRELRDLDLTELEIRNYVHFPWMTPEDYHSECIEMRDVATKPAGNGAKPCS